jgi:hypothetical protein
MKCIDKACNKPATQFWFFLGKSYNGAWGVCDDHLGNFLNFARSKGFKVRRVTCERGKCGKPLYGWEDGTRLTGKSTPQGFALCKHHYDEAGRRRMPAPASPAQSKPAGKIGVFSEGS